MAINRNEWDAAEKEAKKATGRYVHKFAAPFEYQGKTYDALEFDFAKLTGRDSLAIEDECEAVLGKAVIVPALSGQYLVRMAARACTEKIGSDVIMALPLTDFTRIQTAARNFLLKQEQ